MDNVPLIVVPLSFTFPLAPTYEEDNVIVFPASNTKSLKAKL